jgi:hypothetical protein
MESHPQYSYHYFEKLPIDFDCFCPVFAHRE